MTLFKVLKDCWDTLDLDDIHLPNIPAFYRIDKDEFLSFINSKLQDADHLPRCDYKEYLELDKLFLGVADQEEDGEDGALCGVCLSEAVVHCFRALLSCTE